MYTHICTYYIHVLMRDEKEERTKLARSKKQTRQSSTYYIHVLMRDEKEERTKLARSNKQTRQSSTYYIHVNVQYNIIIYVCINMTVLPKRILRS